MVDNQKEITIPIHYFKRKLNGILSDFPKEAIAEGVKRNNKKVRDFNKSIREVKTDFEGLPLDKVSDYKNIKICSADHKDKTYWWIYYEPSRMTGYFNTKDDAVNWFRNGGR